MSALNGNAQVLGKRLFFRISICRNELVKARKLREEQFRVQKMDSFPEYKRDQEA
jgi:hypothetical protein